MSAAAWYLSTDHQLNRFMAVTVSSGIGSKIFDRYHPDGVLDSTEYSGEIGHMVVDVAADAPTCDCGCAGHLGAISSGRGVERLARKYASRNPVEFEESACARIFGATPTSLANEQHLVPAALLGDRWATDVIQRSIDPLATVLLAVTLAVGLEKVIIIGGFALSLGPLYITLLRQALMTRAAPGPFRLNVNSLVQLGDTLEEACLRGAAQFVVWRRRNEL
jgi:glucokinase